MNRPRNLSEIEDMELSPLDRLVQRLNRQLDEGNFDEPTVEALDERAQRYAREGQRDLALLDTAQMLDIFPHHAAGYLREGSIYSMYGHQREAIPVYAEGLARIAASDISGLQKLKNALHAASIQNIQCVDFIRQLPPELANTVLAHLSMSEASACLEVSRTWRARAICCSALWRNISIDNSDTSILVANAMPYISNDVRHLTIATGSLLRDFCFYYMKFDGFANLQSLVLKVGDFSSLKDPCAVTSLQMSANSISGTDIEVLLRKCRSLRRLVMHGCDATVLSPIYNHASNLEILCYNPPFPIPELHGKAAHHVRGLRCIVAPDGISNLLPASAIFPLLYRNMTTLEYIRVGITPIWGNELAQLQRMYPHFKLPKVLTLGLFWSFEGIQTVILQAIRETKTIFQLLLAPVYGQEDTARIRRLAEESPETTLHLSNEATTSGSGDLVELFNRLAKFSERRQNGLGTIALQNCTDVTDAVLLSLAGIKTLREVVFHKTPNITGEGIIKFFSKAGSQLQWVWLSQLRVIADSHLAALGKCEHLIRLELSYLQDITDDGVRSLVDGRCFKLDQLIVKKCPRITKDCVEYAKRKVKTVLFHP
ncbi:hypothetical protein BJV82DRAFT_672638 [Fennellomyces sp. T-0311]|nr:hypothetical protein BJV82DRAFT_672638 [Fennellomyces sp. T-0311]